MYNPDFMQLAIAEAKTGIENGLGDRTNLPTNFLEQQDRDLCLELFNEYANIDKTIY